MIQTTIYIARHGECIGNAEQKLIEPMTDVLTPTGQAQAELLGSHLSEVPFTRAYSSNYPRAKQTAEAVIAANETTSGKSLTVKPDPRIRERDYTAFLGMPAKDGLALMYSSMKQGTPYLKVEVPDCETVSEFEGRIASFFRQLFADLQKSGKEDETVLIVSHGLTIQRLLVLLNTQPELLGVTHWESNRDAERQMRNTTYHKLQFQIARETPNVSGRVERRHCRDHIDNPGQSETTEDDKGKVKDANFSYLDQANCSGFEQETFHYCKPV